MDNLKSFYTGWGSGQELASQDNQRYTTLNSQALANTGSMNNRMLDHVNDIQTMVMTGKDKNGQPLTPQQKLEMTQFVSEYQRPYSQGVFSPAPWSSAPEPSAPILSETPRPTPPVIPMPRPSTPAMPMMPTADLNKSFAPLPSMQPVAPIANPGISSQMQIPPVTAPTMPPMQQGNLTMPQAPPAPAPRRKAKRKVTVRPSNPVTTGNALQPQLSLAR